MAAPDHWPRVQEIFEAAIARAPSERPALLREACGDDAELRGEVESLLEHESRVPGDFLEPQPPRGVGGFAASEDSDALIGRRIGHYQVVRLIATGGMGSVYEAVQEQPRRTVALKVLRQGMGSRSAIRRFESEAQILGRLQHPHIAQVYEAGVHVEGGLQRPYFAMEYVPNARPITRYADEQGLDTRSRLELFAKVCDAVQHGHQKGIIHRDLKPANILVAGDEAPAPARSAGPPSPPSSGQHGDRPLHHRRDAGATQYTAGAGPGRYSGQCGTASVKIIDFGVARVTDTDVALATQHTLAGQVVGTVQYMSPEQCDGDPDSIDTRSDVYSLGVVLYELLTGALPYEATGSTIYAATRAIKEQQPARPSTKSGWHGRPARERRGDSPEARRAGRPAGWRGPLARELRGDIDTIVLKALEKDREKRYASAADLAQDIRRYLNREPIEARPPTRWTRAVHWVARHPYTVTLTGCLLIAAFVFAATYVSVWFVNRRPHRIVLVKAAGHEHEPYAQEARLEALSGRPLRTRSGPRYDSVRLAELVDRPRELGGGKVAVVLCLSDERMHVDWFLRVYDTRISLVEPEWIAELRDGDPLPDPHGRSYTAREFNCCFAATADVFTEHPGGEIVTCHVRNPYSQSVIRIYDLRGEVLYEIWHDGAVGACYWMADAKQLVLVSENAEVYWEDRGYPGIEYPHPCVVYAIRPKYREPQHAFLGTRPGDGPRDPVWYKCLWPPEIVGNRATPCAVQDLMRPHTADPGRAVEVGVRTAGGLGWSWQIDEHGDEIPGSRVIPDNYRRAFEAAATQPGSGPPDPSLISLRDLPPIITPATRPAEP